MDTLKIMLGATIALLLVAVGVSYKSMNQEVRNAPEEEIGDLRRQLLEMEQESERLKLERERRVLRDAVAEPSPTDAVTREDAAVFAARLEELERENQEIKDDVHRAEQEAEFLTGRHAESRDKEARRVRVINDALLIARVKEWVEDPQFGGFATLSIERPDNVQPGTVLAIRRNGGVLGKLRVGEVGLDGAVANPVTAFGEVKPQPGDELILDEIVQLAN
ncbi:hypothetical protein [Haloferula sp.]|uniref:hypothetical protein n=1 Tax=Haloferula sp. TaxID=2497595 RepID=UPI00329BA995